MGLFVIGIIVAIIGIVALIGGAISRKGAVSVGGMIGIILAILIIVGSCVNVVPTGYTGVLTTFGRVEDRSIEAGINFTAPWQDIIKIDNRSQKANINSSAFSSDIQQVDIKGSVNYKVNSDSARELYRTVGTNYFDNVMAPRILENFKAVFSRYTAESLVANRDVLSAEIANLLAEDMKPYGITIISVAIEDIDFTDAFTNAVEAKQVAQQEKLTAETQQARLTMEQEALAERNIIVAKAEAEQAIISANADLEVVKIQAEASLYAGEREAEMNRRIAESISPELIDYYWIKQWTGELPTFYGGDNLNPIIDLR